MGVCSGLGLRLRLGRVSRGPRARGLHGSDSVPARHRLPEQRRGAGLRLLARSRGGGALAALAHQLVLLPVLALVLLAAVEGAAAAATAQQVLHLPAQLAVLPVSLARARPARPAAVIGHGGGGGGGRGGAREGGAAGSLITVPGEGEPVPAEQHAGRGTEPRRRPAAQRADEAAAGAEAGAGVHRAVHEQARHLRGG